MTVFGSRTDRNTRATEIEWTSPATNLWVATADGAMKVTTDAVQTLGGAGYTRDFRVERLMREAKVTQIFEGTNQIQRMVVARALARGLDATVRVAPA